MNAVESLEDEVARVKRFSTLQALLALRGYQVHAVTTGGYFVSRWNLAKFCSQLEDLEAFACQVGATS